MANISGQASDAEQPPIESRRAPREGADAVQPVADLEEDGIEPVETEMGELAPEAARPSPLDGIVEAERDKAPRD